MNQQKAVLARIAADFEQAWRSSQRPSLAEFVNRVVADSRSQLLRQLLPIDEKFRRQLGESVAVDDYRQLCESHGLNPEELLPTSLGRSSKPYQAATVAPYPISNQSVPSVTNNHLPADSHSSLETTPFVLNSNSDIDAASSDGEAKFIGRYRAERILGKGGFGSVYLALDEQLGRRVAIKVPHPHLFSDAEQAEAYIAEARTVASLDHPNIVQVFDVGSTSEYPLFVVSKFIEGDDLSSLLKRQRFSYRKAAELIGTVADALHYAHKKALVHRDVKPGNILIARDGQPYVVDFGLALREECVGKGPQYAGTPTYMSPEQARGEGHRVDGRSDIFSLGAVFYEMLVGRRAFRGDTLPEVFEQITSYEPKPPRQYDEGIPKELERICLKALAKRATERYSNAFDMTSDLRQFLKEHSLLHAGNSPATPPPLTSGDADRRSSDSAKSDLPTPTTPLFAESQPLKIVPKGLRSFDAHDADFFLELLPGARDRSGLPDSLRFWKTRIEETDPDLSFTVALIYGPSGCGKSSLIKAGLLPRLSEDVIAVYLEATSDDSERRLLSALQKKCPALDEKLGLKESMSALRRGQGIPPGKKLIVVLDQFEQLLHAKPNQENSELLHALRHCDGTHLQAILMVRDDFWMAATRFMRDLEVRLIEGQNSAAVDLFPIRHAKKVLLAFGQAFSALPNNPAELSADQKSFVKEAVKGLSEDEKVVCVRLAIFAEMMKGRSWTPATLKAVGGTHGVGVTFLEETFSAKTAPPEHRYHQQAARAVLRSLLPEAGTDIKGAMRSEGELRVTSGYDSRPDDFDDLIRMLDCELRLITPSDFEDTEGKKNVSNGSNSVYGPNGLESGLSKSLDSTSQKPLEQFSSTTRHYQLTHDYLVSSLREWLTRKQRETKKGRAELKLEESSAVWNDKRENRFLPSLWEFANIRLLTNRNHWTEKQRAFMSQATSFHSIRSILVTLGLFFVVAVGVKIRSNLIRQQELARIDGLMGRLMSAEPSQIPTIVREFESNPELATKAITALLHEEAETLAEKRIQLHARLANVSRDPSLVNPLMEELLSGKLAYVAAIRELLRPYAPIHRKSLETLLRDSTAQVDRRFRAALALADYVPTSEAGFWTQEDFRLISRQLVSSNPEFQPLLRELLNSIKSELLSSLEVIFADSAASSAERLSAANALADYASDDSNRLIHLLEMANPDQYSVLFPVVSTDSANQVFENLTPIATTQPSSELEADERITMGFRRANSALTMFRFGERDKAWNLFDWTDDPEAMTQFVFGCRPRGMPIGILLELLEKSEELPTRHQSISARYSLMLAIGEYSFEEIPSELRNKLVEDLTAWYSQDPSSTIHGSAGWLLRTFGQDDIVMQVDQTEVPFSKDREWFTVAFSLNPAKSQKSYQTYVVVQPGSYSLGSPLNEFGRKENEKMYQVELTRPFAILDREITFEEMIAFRPDYENVMKQPQFRFEPSFAGIGFNWFEAVSYCRWITEKAGFDEAAQAYENPEDVLPENRLRSSNAADAELGPPVNWQLDLSRPGFRLPTESEWEVACRANSRTAYSFGSDPALLDKFCWRSHENSNLKPVKLLRPNFRGLYDIHGNACEWTHNWTGEFADEEIDPTGPMNGTSRIARGGAWKSVAAGCRSSDRGTVLPNARTDNGGFRTAFTITEEMMK